MRITDKRPKTPGWYWYILPGSIPLQPAFVFQYTDDELYYTLNAIEGRYSDECDSAIEVNLADKHSLWSDEAIPEPSLNPFGN